MLTQKKRLYAQARISGKNQTDSAIYAGCPPATAAQAASRYEKDPEIASHISRLQSGVPEPEPVKQKRQKRSQEAKEIYQKPDVTVTDGDDPLQYLRDVMNDTSEDPRLRLEAAKTLASYLHAKPGEKGKKEQKNDDAKKVASKFAPSAPPRLVAAGGLKV